MAFFPSFVQSEFAPMFKFLDDYANYANSANKNNGDRPHVSKVPFIRPKFDVKESEHTYELHGELPGIEHKDITLEWLDSNTLSIHGHAEHTREEGIRPHGLIRAKTEPGKTVQDEESLADKTAVDDKTNSSSTNGAVEPATTVVSDESQSKRSEHWMCERSVGDFARTFCFPKKIVQDNVKANLKNGVLSIVVTKAPFPQSKRINID